MKYELIKEPLSKIKTDALVIGVFKGEKVGHVFKSLDDKFPEELANHIEKHLEDEGFKGKEQEIVTVPTFGQHPSKTLYIVGLGAAGDYTHNCSRSSSATVSRKFKSQQKDLSVVFFARNGELKSESKSDSETKGKSKKSKAAEKETEALSPEASRQHLRGVIEGWTLGAFDFDKYKSAKNGSSSKGKDKKKQAEKSLGVAGLKVSAADFTRESKIGHAIADATNFARRLIAEPPANMTPSILAQEAKNVAEEGDLSCKILNESQIEKLGMGSFLGVARGADEPPRFIVLKYSAPNSKHTVGLVGKGITFDSGGLSLKPAASMERMKYDMAGAAAVIGTMKAVGAIKPKVSVLAVVAATENMPSGKALHPGDVLKAMNGKTIEVNNTDAEGRLVLADALHYALQQKVDEVIDVATLTGAVIAALGRVAAGIMGSDQALIDRIIKSGEAAGERLWQLPLYDEYKAALKSDVADLKNAGSRGEAGSACAGMFLKEFVDDASWAHLDIAGVGWSEKSKGEINKGGTGFGVRTLSNFVISR